MTSVSSENADMEKTATKYDSLSEARLHALPATAPSFINRRPPPLVLPPLPRRDYSPCASSLQFGLEIFQDTNGGNRHASDNKAIFPGSSVSQRGQKRLHTLHSHFKEDLDSCQIEMYSSPDGAADNGRVSDAAFNKAKLSRADSPRCLCLRPKKIPRPRNVFMLYRQQAHADIVTRHPGIANPNISKIIGQKWRSMSEEEKVPWKELAEEEKKLHHEMYPNYRYQPKRSTKAGKKQPNLPGFKGGKSMTSVNSSGRCGTCGRYYATPANCVQSIPGSSAEHRQQPNPPTWNTFAPHDFNHESSRSGAQSSSHENTPQRQSFDDQWPEPLIAHGKYPSMQGSITSSLLAVPLPGEKRRRNDFPVSYATEFISNVNSNTGKRHQSGLPCRPSVSPEDPRTAFSPHFSATASARASSSSCSKLLPPPVCHPARAFAAHANYLCEADGPRSVLSGRYETYETPTCRHSKLSPDAPNDWPNLGLSFGDESTPSAASKGLFRRSTPAHTPETPAFVGANGTSEGAARSHEQAFNQYHSLTRSAYIGECLDLPPLMTEMPRVLSPGQHDQINL